MFSMCDSPIFFISPPSPCLGTNATSLLSLRLQLPDSTDSEVAHKQKTELLS